MCTDNTSMTTNQSLFKYADGSLVFRLENSGSLIEKKVLKDAHGTVLLQCKKFPLSMAKWTITDPNGQVLAKTRTVSGMVKYGLDVIIPSRSTSRPTFTVTPDPSLSKAIMWQSNGEGQPDTPLCEAAFGSNVLLGMISAAIQDWTYHISLQPGADAALVACLLVIYTDLLEYNALGGAFGMN